MFFSWIFICRLHRGYKKVSTKISCSYQFTTILMDQLLCNVMLYIYISVLVKDRFYVYFVYGISSPTFSWLAALNYFLLQQSPFSFLQCRSKMRKDLLFWQKFKFLYSTPASLSRVVCLRLSKQSSVTARTNFSSQVLVLPAQERFSFKVYVFSKENHCSSRLSRSRFTLSRAYESCLACQRLFPKTISQQNRHLIYHCIPEMILKDWF